MGVALVLKVAGIGFTTLFASLSLKQAGSETMAVWVGLAGVMVAFLICVGEISTAVHIIETTFGMGGN